jgi:hypothetical protein
VKGNYPPIFRQNPGVACRSIQAIILPAISTPVVVSTPSAPEKHSLPSPAGRAWRAEYQRRHVQPERLRALMAISRSCSLITPPTPRRRDAG